jgi:uncharacterized protein YeaO (DUF488 family)
MISIKRIYDKPTEQDGFRVLVDRLWPRGVSKDKAALDAWLKDVAPSPELRTWFGHEPERFTEFTVRYEAELENNPAVAELKHMLDDHLHVTLLYAAQDPSVNHAQVLLTFLQRR